MLYTPVKQRETSVNPFSSAFSTEKKEPIYNPRKSALIGQSSVSGYTPVSKRSVNIASEFTPFVLQRPDVELADPLEFFRGSVRQAKEKQDTEKKEQLVKRPEPSFGEIAKFIPEAVKETFIRAGKGIIEWSEKEAGRKKEALELLQARTLEDKELTPEEDKLVGEFGSEIAIDLMYGGTQKVGKEASKIFRKAIEKNVSKKTLAKILKAFPEEKLVKAKNVVKEATIKPSTTIKGVIKPTKDPLLKKLETKLGKEVKRGEVRITKKGLVERQKEIARIKLEKTTRAEELKGLKKSIIGREKIKKVAGEKARIISKGEELKAKRLRGEELKKFKSVIKERATKAQKESDKFLESIKTGILKEFEKAKNVVRKQIGFQRHTKELSGEALSRSKQKWGIKEWKNATQKQLDNVLEDMKALQKGDTFLSKSQTESLSKFGIKPWTTRREAGKIMGDITEWNKTRSKFFDWFRTIDQKIERTAGKSANRVKNILTRPRADAVTNMVKEEISLKTEMRDFIFDKLGLKSKKSRALIMQYGEGRKTLEQLKKETPKWKEVVEADKWFRDKYNKLLDETNEQLAKFYPPDKLIPKRKDYYTHSQELGNFWRTITQKTGDINPLLESVSQFTKPGRKFNPFALRRKGAEPFVDDAVFAFEEYLKPTLHNKYLTEHIIRHRAVADILAHNTLESKNLNMFINSLQKAANQLSGKTDPFSKGVMESFLTRKTINIINKIPQKFAKNRIIGSVSSALMQTAGVPNSVLKNGLLTTSKGLLSQAASPLMKADPLKKSKFLLTRYGEKGLKSGESIIPTITKKGEKILSIPFEVIETNITKGIWRASFDNAWRQGFKGDELIRQADEITASVVGSRNLGEKALAFDSGILSLPFQFQLEVNTHAQLWKSQVFDKIFKDPVKAAKAAIETTIALYAMNTLYESTMGRTPLPDPIRAVQDTAKMDSWGEKVGRIAGEGLSSVPGGQFMANIFPEHLRKKYFGRSEVGIYPGGIPVVSAVRGIFYKPENAVYDFVLPYGGGQLKRIIEGLEGLDKLGSYNKKGKLQFVILPNEALRVLVFGKYSTPEAKEYFDKQRSPLSEKQTVEYFIRTQAGEDPKEVYTDVAKERLRNEINRDIVDTVVRKIKSSPKEGLAIIQLWKKEGIIDDKMEKEIIEKLTK